MDRRTFLLAGALGGMAPALHISTLAEVPLCTDPIKSLRFEWDEATLEQLAEALQAGTLTSVQLTRAYLERIAQLDQSGPSLRSLLCTNPDALRIAETLDQERRAGKIRGPLHGIPITVKDNIDTGDQMPTTAGSLALAQSRAPRDAFLVARLREAGVVLLGKTNLSEWANIRSSASSSGWSAVGGQCRNPYVLDRNPCGSSSGAGVSVSANLCAAGVGTETDGSIICPSHHNGIVGLKPTVGLISRSGIVPISRTQDTAGPMGRRVIDVALLLQGMVGADASDSSTTRAPKSAPDYALAVRQGRIPQALKGMRLGIRHQNPGIAPRVLKVFEQALNVLREQGAELIDIAEMPPDSGLHEAELEVLLTELKAGLAEYLATRPNLPYKSLADIIQFNQSHLREEMQHFGQELFEQAAQKGGLDSPAYQAALATCARLTRTEGLDKLFATHRIEVLLQPSGGPAWVTDLVNGDRYTGGDSSWAAIAGYPHLTVPMGFVEQLPVGLSFIGKAWEETRLLFVGAAFEQASRVRRAPQFLPTRAG